VVVRASRSQLGSCLVTALMGLAAVVSAGPAAGFVPADELTAPDVISAPQPGHEHGDRYHQSTCEPETEETERADSDLDSPFAVLAVSFSGVAQLARGWRAAQATPALRTLDPIAAHAPRGPPSA
jgi:hypothetical protein